MVTLSVMWVSMWSNFMWFYHKNAAFFVGKLKGKSRSISVIHLSIITSNDYVYFRFTLICMFFMLISKLEDSIFTRISEYKDTISKLLVVQKPLSCCPVIFLKWNTLKAIIFSWNIEKSNFRELLYKKTLYTGLQSYPPCQSTLFSLEVRKTLYLLLM